MNAPTALLVTEHDGWKLLAAPAALEAGYSLATSTSRGLSRALTSARTGYAAVVGIPRDERDAFLLLNELRQKGCRAPAVLVTADPALRERLAELEPAARVAAPNEIARALVETAPPVARTG